MQVIMRTDRLLVEQMECPDVSEGGILLPTQSKIKQAWGTVLMAGPDVEKPDDKGVGGILIGDRIAFADFSGVNVELEMEEGKKEFLVLSQDDVLLVLREEEQGLNEQEIDNHGNTDGNVGDEKEVGPEQGREENSKVHNEVESCGCDV